jgi:hypothetical protein
MTEPIEHPAHPAPDEDPEQCIGEELPDPWEEQPQPKREDD